MTAGDQINRSLRLLGVLAEGETPSAETSQDALVALNQMLESWSTERLAVYSTLVQSFTWPAGQASRTIGPSGDLVGVRPVSILSSTYYTDAQGVSHTVALINEDQYNAIAVKTTSTGYPDSLFVNNTFPNAELKVYPVPDQDLTWQFVCARELAQPALLNTELQFPPGYMRAFAYNLAMELAPEFGVEPSQQVQRIAMTSKRNLKRINNPGDVMSMPGPLVGNLYGGNIYSGWS